MADHTIGAVAAAQAYMYRADYSICMHPISISSPAQKKLTSTYKTPYSSTTHLPWLLVPQVLQQRPPPV
eukprot:1159975-Pelagomonas_calceolata.AAC.4